MLKSRRRQLLLELEVKNKSNVLDKNEIEKQQQPRPKMRTEEHNEE
jgi:hypothetical protein